MSDEFKVGDGVKRLGDKVKASFWELQSVPRAGVVIGRRRVVSGNIAEIRVKVRRSDGTEVEASNFLFTRISDEEYIAHVLMCPQTVCKK
jgi:hypothetical protein